MKRQIKDKKGITLIALVITIIVLLILAGVTIITLTGDNGLITKASNAKNANLEAEEKEKIRLGYNEYKIKKYTDINPRLSIEGATVTGDEINGWNIQFTQNQYELSSNGIIITPVTNPYDENGWEYAYTCTNGEWSDLITKGNTAEGDIVAKFYKQDTLITPSNLVWENFSLDGENTMNLDIPFPERNSYHLVIEGTGDMGKLIGENGISSLTGYQALDLVYFMKYIQTESIPEDVIPLIVYVTDAFICDGVTSIGTCSFAYALSLNNVNISNTVTNIGSSAFESCTNLLDITIPDSVTYMGDGAFWNWTSSQTINIRASSIPDTWNELWNSSCDANIVTGYTGE